MALPPLTVRVTVDDKQLVAGLARVRARVRKLGADFRRMGRQISTFVTAPILALAGVTAKLADTQIRAERTLATVLKFSGGAVEQRLAGFKKFASAMQDITVVGDELTLKNLQVAKSMGLTDEQAKRAAKNAIGLSAAFDVNVKSAIRMTAALEQGNTELLGRHLPALSQVKDATEKAALAQSILADTFTVATTAAKEGLGPLRQMLNDLGDLGEEFGAIIIPALTAFAGKIRKVISAIRDLAPIQKKWIVGLTAAFAAGGPILIGLGLLAAAIGALLTPVGLVVAALAGAGGLIVWLTATSEKFRELTKFIVGNTRVFLQWLGVISRTPNLQLRRLTDEFVSLKIKLADVDEQFKKSIESGVLFDVNLALSATRSAVYVERMEEITKEIEAITRARDALSRDPILPEIEGEQVDEIIRVTLATERLGDVSGNASKELESLRDVHGEIIANLKEEAAGLQLQTELVGKNTKEVAELVAITEAMNDAIREGLKLTPKQIENLKKLAAAVGEAAEELDEKLKQKQNIEGIADDIIGPLKDALKEGELNFQSFADTLVNIASRLRDRMIDELFDPIEDELIKMISTAGGGGGIGGIFSTLIGGLSAAFGGLGGGGFVPPTGAPLSAGAFAHGGSFTVGGRGGVDRNLVPLLLTRGEQVDITPAGKEQKGGENVINITQNIDARGAVEGTVVLIQRALIENNKQLPNIIRDAQRRGF